MTPDEPTAAGDQQHGAPSVADEAARLAEAFAAWAQNGRQATGAAAHDATESAGPGPDPGHAGGSPRPAGCDCAHAAAVEAVCRMCPVCRVAGLLQAVQPELLDRVADLLGLAAGSLHAAAEQRRGAADGTAGPDARDGDGAPRDEHGGPDVPVTGEDED